MEDVQKILEEILKTEFNNDCNKALCKIKETVEDRTLSDSECKEKIIGIFENIGK